MTGTRLAELPGRPCPIAAAIEVVGERWALLIVRELHLGAKTFNEIVQGTGAPRDRVAARLKSLAEAGIVERVAYQSSPQRFEYHLTPSGQELAPILKALLKWGLKHVVQPDDPDRDAYRSAAVSKGSA
ncbi:winged helix-turn-helix transcriptional regulator [Mycolicibacterium parafortuitum]|uniref:HxlR family transcriptional regulator [Modestobacter marinus] n=1 Tax=Mycolicibacterium parafortuitum TaxID=39692 RepID=A0A375YD95_MYCPF|nr:helix-turn-helix domain-containing protein [Mycolicibacterium parafortuitum]ORB31071.1 HxlR family transcriptional regulator [Mycolicibacterium parafortuitum]SRX79102.1 HxlR family transcriptional regulator [Modestobacter marinus] [Mycolicibacterium parafortuitum]